MLLVPRGFAHGYLVIEDADVTYKVSAPYDPGEERGVAWDDPDLAIPWPARPALLSPRDAAQPRLAALAAEDLPAIDLGPVAGAPPVGV
jgi:dTDP-4-dehydrorhamnose 3,5-epimerase